MGRRRHLIRFILVVSGVLAFASTAYAQEFPSRSIRIIVGSDQSSPTSIIGRLLASELTASEGWRIVVENKPGASYMLSAAEVLKQPADGHTLWALALPAATAPALLPSMGFRLETDFAAVIQLSRSYNVLVVHPSVPVHSISELVAHLKANPELTFSSGGLGTPAHLIGEMFKLQTGVRATHVPYPGHMTRAVADLVSGTNQYQFITTLPVVELIAAGRLRALAVTGPKRVPALKDVPTVVEQGYPQLVVQDWTGLAVRSGTPDEVILQLNRAVNKALASARISHALGAMGAEPAGGSAADFAALFKAQIAHWRKVVRDVGIGLER